MYQLCHFELLNYFQDKNIYIIIVCVCVCVLGINRLQRWERAALHGLNPLQEIKDILLKESTDPEYTQGYY